MPGEPSASAAPDHGLPAELPSVFRFSHVRAAGIPEGQLRRWVACGLVERLGRGVYARGDAVGVDMDRAMVAVRLPRATVCLVSALVEHDLIDDNPAWLDVALPRGTWTPRVDLPVRWHSFDTATFEVGREMVEVASGVEIGVYEARRCIIDAFRLQHEVGPEAGVQALRRWLRRPGSQPSQLLAMARSFPAALPRLTAALQVLL